VNPKHQEPAVDLTPLSLFLCGDVMTGRGVDQILPHPCKPNLYESYVRSALDYVQLAENATGSLKRPVDFAYIWGDALTEFDRVRPDVRIVNLETAVTVSEDAWPGKGIQYRMNPANVACLTAAKIDCCSLANNHVLDWGRSGLTETLDTLHRAGLCTAGAGRNQEAAAAPAVIRVPGKGRVLVFACATSDSGVLRGWAAGKERSGVNVLDNLSSHAVEAIARRVRDVKQAGDIAVLSIHWGGNWGFDISPEERRFAHQLIDDAGIDVVHGHSSHHIKGVEIYQGRPIMYGCGDFLNDYEGIGGHELYRSDLSLMYLPVMNATTGRLLQFTLIPTQIRHFRIQRASPEGVSWLLATLNREGRKLGSHVEYLANSEFELCST
jgi:poly-gamma-glutamate capsule biosynthesis protein CapA/YwtB (metallophosphatase superfamily)